METSLTLLERLARQPAQDDWRRLTEMYQPLLNEWLRRAGVPAEDGEDLSQEIFMVVVREVGGFERRKAGAFRAWLRTIFANRARDFFRARQHRPRAGGSDLAERLGELESPESELSHLWDREHDLHVAGVLMRRVQQDFAPDTWHAFVRHVLEGAPAIQVADQLGLSLNSVLLAKSRVLKRLRQEAEGFL